MFLFLFMLMMPVNAQELSDIDWILGSWIQENETGGYTVVETWEKISDRRYRGENVSTDDDGMVVRTEVMTLEVRGDQIFYTAQPDPNRPAVNFEVEKIEDTYFIARNSRNPFPQQIIYTRIVGGMTADLSGRGRLVQIQFKEIEFVTGD
jgi:hypothetical protein